MRTCVHVRTYVYVCTYVHAYVYTVYINVRIRGRMCVRVCVLVCGAHVSMRVRAREGAHVRVFMFVSVCMCVCLWACVSVRLRKIQRPVCGYITSIRYGFSVSISEPNGWATGISILKLCRRCFRTWPLLTTRCMQSPPSLFQFHG